PSFSVAGNIGGGGGAQALLWPGLARPSQVSAKSCLARARADFRESLLCGGATPSGVRPKRAGSLSMPLRARCGLLPAGENASKRAFGGWQRQRSDRRRLTEHPERPTRPAPGGLPGLQGMASMAFESTKAEISMLLAQMKDTPHDSHEL